MHYLKLNDWETYRMAFHLSNYVWDIVSGWPPLARYTIGRQFVDSVDSISANMAEGFGRYGKKDKIRFYRIAFGSCKESLDWNEKARCRHLLTPEQYNRIYSDLGKIPKGINTQIKFTNLKLKE